MRYNRHTCVKPQGVLYKTHFSSIITSAARKTNGNISVELSHPCPLHFATHNRETVCIVQVLIKIVVHFYVACAIYTFKLNYGNENKHMHS